MSDIYGDYKVDKTEKYNECDYCNKIAVCHQELIITDFKTRKKEVEWFRFACEEHRDFVDLITKK